MLSQSHPAHKLRMYEAMILLPQFFDLKKCTHPCYFLQLLFDVSPQRYFTSTPLPRIHDQINAIFVKSTIKKLNIQKTQNLDFWEIFLGPNTPLKIQKTLNGKATGRIKTNFISSQCLITQKSIKTITV